jgi:autotransporter-associated beta strand protein
LIVNPSANLSTMTLNSLKLAGSTVTINGGQTLTLSSGGLLVPNAAAATAISGGTLLGGLNADLIVIQNSLANAMTISSVIADNTNGVATAGSALTKASQGTLILTGNNTYTGPTYINGAIVSGGAGTGPGTIPAGTLQIGSGGTAGSIASSSAIFDNGTLAFNRTDTVTYGTPISGVGGIRQAGSGTTILTGNNTYSGPITVAAGTLQIGNGAASGSFNNASSVNITAGTFAINRSGALSYNGNISGLAGSLTVTGGGTVTLGGTNTYAGSTTINSGTLALGASATLSASTPISIASGALLDVSAPSGITLNGAGAGQLISGNGSVKGSVTSGGNTRISPGGDGVIGSMTLSNDLTLNGGTITIDASGAGSRDLLTVKGNLNLNSGTIVWANSGAAVPDGTYKIISYNGALGGAVGNLSVSGFNQFGHIAALSSSIGGEIDLVVSTYVSVELFWQGNGTSNPWDVASTADWTNSAGSAALFHQFDNATFNDSSANTAVNLTGTLTPAAVTINGTVNSYTFQGNGQLASGNLTNNNPNTLTILTTNTAGNITINAGTVQYGNGATAGAPGNGSVFNNSALVFNEPDVETLGGAMSGAGSLTVQAGGLKLSGNNAAYSGTATISATTTLQVGVGSGVGTLGTGPVVDNGVLIFDRSGALTFGGAISGAGSVSNIGPGTVTLSGANSYVGFTYVNGGTLQVGSATAIPTGPGATNVVVNGGANASAAGILDLNGLNLAINGLDGAAGTVQGQVVNNGGSTAKMLILGNADGAGTYNGQIKDNTGAGGSITLVKTGTNTQTLSINTVLGNPFSGGTVISNGTLSLTTPGGNTPLIPAANQVGLGTGPVTFFGTNGTLSLAGASPQSTVPTWGIAFANTVIIPAGQAGTINPVQRGLTSPTLQGSGTLNYWATYVRGEMNGDWSAFTGNIIISGFAGGQMGLDNNIGMPNAHVSMTTNVVLYGRIGGTPTIPIGELSGGDDSDSIVSTSPANAGGAAANFMIGGLNTSTSFGGRVLDSVGIIKVGTGTFTLTNGTLSYSGITAVSNGVLAFATALPSASATYSLLAPGILDVSAVGGILDVGSTGNQTIRGDGTLRGSLNLGGTGVMAAGLSNRIGTLTITNDATLGGTVFMELSRTNGSGGTNDQLVAKTITLGGTLNVTNIGSTLHVGDTFKLFRATSTLSGSFSAVNFAPTDGNNMAYTFADNTAVDGSITVLSVTNAVNTTPTNITYSFDGNQITLSWPVDHIGWRLQAQTNSTSVGLTATWFDVAGSTTTNQVIMPVAPANGCVFYRMIYP